MKEFTADPVPLYLIPQRLSSEIHRLGDSITEVQVKRTVGHHYRLWIRHESQGGTE